MLLQWRLLRRRRQVGRVLLRDSGLLRELGQQRLWQGFSGHGHRDFVAVQIFHFKFENLFNWTRSCSFVFRIYFIIFRFYFSFSFGIRSWEWWLQFRIICIVSRKQRTFSFRRFKLFFLGLECRVVEWLCWAIGGLSLVIVKEISERLSWVAGTWWYVEGAEFQDFGQSRWQV